MFYDNFKEACERKGTNITAVLSEIDRASGNTGSWKLGKYPRLDIVMEMAEHLEMSLDDFVYGTGRAPYSTQIIESDGPYRIDPEWAEILSHIPVDKQQLCKDFMKTHMVVPDKFTDAKKA